MLTVKAELSINYIPNEQYAKQENFFTSSHFPYSTKYHVVKKKIKTFLLQFFWKWNTNQGVD
jgi:hypothetical protein